MAVLEIDGIAVSDDRAGYEQLAACAASCRERYGEAAPGDVAGVQAARSLFRLLRIDPTRHRPSSESLLNRVLKGRPLPSVNTLVDVGNFCSLDFLLPIGIYDRAKIVGGVVLREGRPGETYDALGGRQIDFGGKYVLADEQGPFGSPMTDSVRTSITTSTTSTAIFIYAPPDYDETRLDEHAQTMAGRVIDVCGGRVARCELVRGEAP